MPPVMIWKVAGRPSPFMMGTATRNWFMLLSSKVNETAARFSNRHLAISVCPISAAWPGEERTARQMNPARASQKQVTRFIRTSCGEPGVAPRPLFWPKFR